ncbi:P-loop containing nucleoside triphosphate hydrolase protein [Auriculariales sp. MPI-PUGE-AT-0066]|nr:P-loop containing nucleoside triphosphate hydrolase protein [Auriculariales sp. MPI-PUGE-AT-0066]
MAEGLPWPLKAAPQTALQVIRQLEDAKASEPKANNLIRLICDFGQMLAQHQSKDLDDEAMRPHIRRFFDHLQVILIRVRICRATGKFKTLTTASRIKSVIEEEASNVQRAQELLVTAFAVATHSIVRDIKKTLLESPHNIPMQIRGGIYISAVPPPMAIVFHGREQQLETLLQALLADKPARLGISGAGGIGKTALALAILHNERIKLRCGNNRIFISCEAAVDVDGLLAIFAQTLALPLTGDLLATIAHYFKSRPGSLVVLDNIETIWLSRNSALNLQMERFLGQLAEIDELDLIVTTRGTLLPSSVRWSNRSDAALDTLYFDAARKVFQETVQETAGGEDEDEALNELLREVDFMPLAVTLLARLGELPSYLLSQWKEMYTELLQVDSHDNSRRELSVEVSIQLSLNFLPSPGFDPEPFQLLAVCSLLPDGIFPETLESLQPTFTRLDRAVRILRHHALIYFGLMGELRMLSPIRHYLRKKLHVSGKHFAAIRMRYYALAASVPTELAEDFPNRSAKIAPEYGNMTSVLLLLISTEAPTEPLFAAVDSVTQYSYWTTRSSALCEAWIARGGGSPEWLAKMWNAVGRLNSYRNDLKTSQCNYETARGLYEQAGNRASAMQATRSIGYTLLQQDLYDEAETMFKEAHAFFMEQNDEVKSADCVQDLSMVCDCRLDHPTAIKHQFAARQVYVAHEKKLQAALALANIGNQHNAMENFQKQSRRSRPPCRNATPLVQRMLLATVACNSRTFIASKESTTTPRSLLQLLARLPRRSASRPVSRTWSASMVYCVGIRDGFKKRSKVSPRQRRFGSLWGCCDMFQSATARWRS